jgi:glycosyltransferase involved in cell wall biosynthesis
MQIKNILVLTTSYPLDNGKIEGSFVAEHCEQLLKAGCRVTVVCPHMYQQLTRTEINGVQVRRFKYFYPLKYQRIAYGAGILANLRRNFLAILQLPLFFAAFFSVAWQESRGHELLFCHWTIPALTGILVKKIKKNIRVVFMNYGVEVFVLGRKRAGKILFNAIISNIDLMISCSSFTEMKTIAVINKKVKSLVLSPGVNMEKFKSSSRGDSVRNDHGIEANDILLFSLGYFIERKGFAYLIQAMDKIVNAKKINHVKLIMGGRGPLKTALESEVLKLKLGMHVFFSDYIEDHDMPDFFNACDIFVHPAIIDASGDTEGLGVVLLEANACGKPVIASNVGGITDVVINTHNGLLIEEKNVNALVNAITQLAADPELRRRLGKNGKKIVEDKFCWKKNMEFTFREIESLM